MLALKPFSLEKLLSILIISLIIILTVLLLALGQLVDRKLESVMLLHDFYTIISIMTSAGFIGLLVFNTSLSNSSVNILKLFAIITAISVFLLILTGTIGYVYYRLSDPDSAKSIIKKTFPFAHDVMFETMEYLGLIGFPWAVLLTYLTIHYNTRIFTERHIKNVMFLLTFVALGYCLFISVTGIIPTKIASVQG